MTTPPVPTAPAPAAPATPTPQSVQPALVHPGIPSDPLAPAPTVLDDQVEVLFANAPVQAPVQPVSPVPPGPEAPGGVPVSPGVVAPPAQPAPPVAAAPEPPAPPAPVIDPFVSSPPAPSATPDTIDFFGTQLTRHDAQVLVETHQWLSSLSEAQVQRLATALSEPVAQPQYAAPQHPGTPAPTAPVQGQFFGAPAQAPVVAPAPAPAPIQEVDPWGTPQSPDPNAAYVQQLNTQIAQLQAQVQQTQQSGAEFQAQYALQQQAAALKPYGDRAIADTAARYQIPQHEVEHMVTRAQGAGDMLRNAFAQAPNDPYAAYSSVLDAIVWADPTLRARAVNAQAAAQQATLEADRRARAQAGRLSGSGGSVPRVDPTAPVLDASGQPDRMAGMVADIRTAMAQPANGQG